ncbi:putative indole-3-pyruvate monooxygenase YUCCA11 [Grifola frondosa]|uniref:Putative indole-3-pyruvate monooxygenase YUCCA11 n=1 Tax=Grifola frondosa TaxID=5627 RepID=A0A1C7LNX4_GRIFR|nr:putative indole-3-pyruvate monooxygenase YUCCA11 [Grifola frondosa]
MRSAGSHYCCSSAQYGMRHSSTSTAFSRHDPCSICRISIVFLTLISRCNCLPPLLALLHSLKCTMSTRSIGSEFSLPTLDKLHASVPTDISPSDIAAKWLRQLSDTLKASDSNSFTEMFLEDAFWRDILALSWDYRSIRGTTAIRSFFDARAMPSGLSILNVAEDQFRAPILSSPFPDVSWIQFGFDLQTSAGKGLGYARLVPTENGKWKAFTLLTTLESLNGVIEKGPNPDSSWLSQDRHADKVESSTADPIVLVVGAGHSGLEVAARLERFNIPTLVVEKFPRVGDNWRNRYKSLYLHDPRWYNRLPLIPHPPEWPMYAPSAKVADWLEAYAQSLQLNVWPSSNITRAQWDDTDKKWTVSIACDDGTDRSLRVKYIVFANGFGGGVPSVPDVPGQDSFLGEIVHSSAFRSAEDYLGKRVLVVGSGNSGHDIAQDLAMHDIDVTMYQRSSTYVISIKAISVMLSSLYYEGGPPIDVADHLSAASPFPMAEMIYQRLIPHFASTIDKELLQKLKSAGFGLNMGLNGAGALSCYLRKGGGYYIDVGASTLISEGKIRLKTGAEIKEIIPRGVRFTDGAEVEADTIVFATGFGDSRDLARRVCGADVAAKLSPVWGLDDEGELQSVWRDSGHPGLFFATGNFAISRQFSKYLALQIKAQEEGVFGPLYSLHKHA